MPGATTNLALPYPLNSEPFADGAEAIQALAEAIDGGIGALWQNGGNFSGVTIGDGVQKIRYRIDGTTCFMQGAFKMGATSDVTGAISAPLPAGVTISAALATVDAGLVIPVGVAHAFDSSATGRQFGEAVASPGGSSVTFRRTATAEGAWGFPDTVPFTWADGDYLAFTASFEVD